MSVVCEAVGVFTLALAPGASIARAAGVAAVRAAARATAPEAAAARLEYALLRRAGAPELELELRHTITPAAARGRGLAAQLTVEALRWAAAAPPAGAGAAAVRPTCTYAAEFFARRARAPGGAGATAEVEGMLLREGASAVADGRVWRFVDR